MTEAERLAQAMEIIVATGTKEAAHLLRSQAAEIEKLTKNRDEYCNEAMRYLWVIEKLRDELKAIKSAEPVAWTWDTKSQYDGFVDAHFQFSKPDCHPDILNLRPLYTHPAPKQEPLADEQIDAVWVKYGLDDCDPHGFARAIEAAHGIGVKE